MQELACSEVIVEIWLLREKSNLCFHPRIINCHTQDARRAGRRKYQSHQQLERRGFSRTVRSKKAEYLASFYLEVQRLQGLLRLPAPKANRISFFQTQGFYRGHCGCHQELYAR